MSQNETVEELDTTVTEEDVATSTDDNEEDNTTSDDEITWEEIHRLRKDSESLKKANKKIAMLEKGVKKAPENVNPSNLSEDELDALLEKRDFYKGNTQAKELRDKIEAMVTASGWVVDRSKAFELLSWDAEIEENRKVYSRSTLAWENTSTAWFSPISIDKYDSLSAKQQAEYNAKSTSAKGGVVFK